MTPEPTLADLHADAYEQWKQQDAPDFDAVLARLPVAQRDAVILGDFHFQVCRGGFSQWERNQYAVQLPDLVRMVEAMPDSDAVVEVRSILASYQKHVLGQGEEDLMDLTLRYFPVCHAFYADADVWIRELSHE
ncbi:hypothetical protein HNQ07_004703 [Deinococcus metalli]|uniref:DNA mimic protein DMP19 C-terminal domain-containing protein n=1 Tax=Deinococcus metalli TaxID=1141878 RepID=A0A7W8NTJ3_9DEIO|nr:hypothetical protein [Deinococcus metalli]MBB5379188.1 hypothetical protein [Deinococcus metalli]GHF65256.1 hypothetical protein GCM10017781_46240 [Deinococcus metalli]